MNTSQKALTAWMIAMINVAAIINIKSFPLLAEYGLSIILFLFLSSIFFFIPVAFISAELASTFPDRGIYTWVRDGIGPRWGFLAIWLQWMENVVWYPTILSFIAATFAYLINPSLATNKFYILSMILGTFWPITFINFLGMRTSGWISSLSAIFGTLFPITLIIIMSFGWYILGNPIQIEISFKSLIPDLTSINQLVLLAGVLLGLCGLEMSAVHAKDVQNPSKTYPKAIILSASLILIFSVLGALAIAALIPAHEIQLASGSMDAFKFLFETLDINWALPILAVIMTLGGIGMMSTWIVGPSRGLLATAEHGDLPPIFQKKNQTGMPTAILITQALIVTILSIIVLIFMPSVNSAYWILTALTSILYMLMYILMFIAAIRLRRKYPTLQRPYQVPGGNKGLWIICLTGILGSCFGCTIGFFPPSQLETGNIFYFESFLILSTLGICIAPFLIYYYRKPFWKNHL